MNHHNTWLGYMASLGTSPLNPDLSGLQKLERFLSIENAFSNMFSHSIPAFFLLDYTSGEYLVMSNRVKSILNVRENNFLDGGIDYTLDIFQKEDLRVFNDQLFADRLRFMKGVAHDEFSSYIFSYNHRLRGGKGNYVDVVQRSCFLSPDERGNPQLSFGMLVAQEHFAASGFITQTIEKVASGDGESGLVFKKRYFLQEEDRLFSKREREVLLRMAEGLGTKQIADRLSLSEHTVINHKRHMLEKSGCLNSVALVSYAIRSGII